MRYSNLLFDGDDTLFDFSKAADYAFRALCRLQDIPDTPDSRRVYREINQVLWDAFDRGELTKEYVVLERFVRFLRVLGLAREPEACNRDYLAALGEGVYPLPHAEEVCRRLAASHRLYLITNAVASVQHSRLRASVFAPYFAGSFTSEDAGASKPDAAYFRYALSRIAGASPDNCLVIGDSPATDLRGANNANLPCCWFNPTGAPRPAGLRIDYEIRTLPELYGIV